MISFLNREDINEDKWDACISNSWHETIYGYSWYLDAATPSWSGLVLDDYTAVMPLVCNKKMGVWYVLNLPFVQYTSIYGSEPNQEMLKLFIDAIPPKFKLIDTNIFLPFEPKLTFGEIKKRTNLIIEPQASHDLYKKSYNTNTKRNLKKAESFGIYLEEEEEDPELMISTYIRFKKIKYNTQSKPEVYKRLRSIIADSIKRNRGKLFYAYAKNGQFIGASYFVTSTSRSIYLFSASDPEVDLQGAMFKIIDHQLNNISGKDLILDFEGSEIEGIARFYRGFGTKTMTYYNIKINKLPKLLRGIKR